MWSKNIRYSNSVYQCFLIFLIIYTIWALCSLILVFSCALWLELLVDRSRRSKIFLLQQSEIFKISIFSYRSSAHWIIFVCLISCVVTIDSNFLNPSIYNPCIKRVFKSNLGNPKKRALPGVKFRIYNLLQIKTNSYKIYLPN